ncbi:ABC transporter ATP-binding protein [Pseudoalteromonas luteoviolacea]|uniref:ABC transporter n=1 Tax=Pseudoalteromonas luteoviolacea S4054 TaxID=1129367 RepID=A0A0F6AD80_9GAMM|nr:ABC transporter ATP-binding protein [Pseudoalteromonas luteoviolacea]AOT08383.1 ABC transporter ATP-binding protein [Pseudoalteromonas luteoviolacea]AOT13299.1 ABC transporter ATP-binding protein [Pseudoalteromonas luteoviolacea]AOT18212.1 ABC transporter ATP-binding protein [Pseudoalteromonas luteoviolacea]KKE84140.1 ABC transporter [Pseudoalteromonas luteoviolacea S4054]KZN75822.1 ABC transporter [Pseudoalteromonas luteoviolacea S4047-1]
MANTPVIELVNVSKVYVSENVETHALTDINLSINKGEYISISGPSGCGKSTLLSLMGLLDDITDGTYKIEGVDTQSLDADTLAELRNLHIGFIFQSFNLIDELSVFDNVALPLIYREQPLSQEDINTRVTRALSQVEIEHRANHKPNQLSGGQQQRVAIARALAGEPSILLVDEPTGNLDSKNGDAVMAILESLNQQGTTICMVTHDPRYAGYAKKQIKLFDGSVLNTSELGHEASRKMA